MVNRRAQTAMELAIFGAILIFVIGTIVRQALSSSYAQNQQLRAMREAMQLSHQAGISGQGQRQTASITFIEDRLAAESGKYAAIERTPYVVSASATHNSNLLMPISSAIETNLPVADIIINGKQFALTLARFKTVELAKSCKQSPCPEECKGSCGDESLQFYPASGEIKWIDDCAAVTVRESEIRSCQNQNPCPKDCNGDCDPSSSSSYMAFKTSEENIGCAKLYDVVYNHKGYKKWCESDPCLTPDSNTVNLTADQRFDLNRDDTADVPPEEYPKFYWQWFLVAGYDANYRPPPEYVYSDAGTAELSTGVIGSKLLMGEGIGIPLSDCDGNDCPKAKNTFIDVDGDLKQESVMALTEDTYYYSEEWVDKLTGIIKKIRVMDMQDGDYDGTHADSDKGPKPGLTNDAKMYASLRDGTYLLLEEGRLYKASCDPTSNSQDCAQFIRTVQKKDQVDVIERTIRLSNDTQRFCNGGNPPSKMEDGSPNPVEACGNCFSSGNLRRTCMEIDADPVTLGNQSLIYVRSRLKDRRGRKWITQTSGDDSVDFVVPGAKK